MHGIEKYRAQNWRIARVSGRASAFFSLRHVLYPASGMRRRKHEMAHEKVLRMIQRLHKMWFNRVKSLVTNQLWSPGDSLTRTGNMLTYRRIMHCRPSCVFYTRGNIGKLRPCRRDKFCPFCWARAAAAVYPSYKKQIRIARKVDKNLVLMCRVAAQHLPATNMFAQDTQQLRQEIERYCAAYKRTVKQLQRKTLGSAWRVVVNPVDTGWQIETRQLLLCAPETKSLLVKADKLVEVATQQTLLTDDNAIFDVLGRFVEYPTGLMTAQEERAAVVVNAEAALRTSSGTGVFRSTGKSLARKHLKKVRHVSSEGESGIQIAADSIRFALDVSVRPFIRR